MKKTAFLVACLSLGLLTACPSNQETTSDDKGTYYTATFVNFDGTQIESKSWLEGTIPTAPANPTRPNDSTYSYTFKGWAPELGPITKDTKYTATYTSTELNKTVNRSDIRKIYKDILDLWCNDDVEISESDEWYEEYNMYSMGDTWSDNKTQTMEAACDEAKTMALTLGYTLVTDTHKMTWEDDGSTGYEANLLADSKFEINIGASIEDGINWIYLEVYAKDGYTVVDDISEGETTKEMIFTKGDYTGSLDTSSMKDFVSYINGNDDYLSNVVLGTGGYAQVQNFQTTKGYDPYYTLCLGSGSKNCSLTFTFKYVITSITITAQAYWKYDTYNKVYNQDSVSKLYSNDDLLLDLTTTDKSVMPPEKTSTLTFDEKDNVKTLNLNVKEGKQRVFINKITVTYVIK